MDSPIVITGARAPVAIDLARAFAASGREIRLADSATSYAARCSNVGRGRVLRLPRARGNFSLYRSALQALVAEMQPELIVPTCEEVFFVAAVAAQCGFAERVFAPPLALLRTLHSKIDFPAFARSLGIAAPETWAIDNVAQCRALPLPPQALVFKPEFSRFGTSTLIRPTHASLQRVHAAPDRRWAAQRHVAGEEICLWAAARSGSIVASAAYRPVRRLGQAAAYAFETMHCPPALAIATTIAAATGMSGQLSFDIILTAEGEAVPIECNPRSISGVHLFDGEAALADALLGTGAPVHATSRLRYLGPAMALFAMPRALSGGRWSSFVDDIRRGRDALTRPGDRWPAVGAVVDTTGFVLRGALRAAGAASASTADIEWNGEALE
jgi:hypothetical protein